MYEGARLVGGGGGGLKGRREGRFGEVVVWVGGTKFWESALFTG